MGAKDHTLLLSLRPDFKLTHDPNTPSNYIKPQGEISSPFRVYNDWNLGSNEWRVREDGLPAQGELQESPTERERQLKRLTIAATLILAGVFAYGVAAHAQTASKADPVKVDPKHYKMEFENQSVRVLRISYGPGEKSVMHNHPNAVAVYLTDGLTRMTTPDGKSQDVPAKAGGAEWTPAGTHLPQNVGNKSFELVLVELKK
jgi:quercetin dioxygenase-like cupin family protein